jgi:hypothetical protein
MNTFVAKQCGISRARLAEFLLLATAWGLIAGGAVALFLGATKRFLPHDVAFLQMTPQDLCARNECRIVHFMIHDRIAFGGAVLAIGVLYLWLVRGPLRHGEMWAWRAYAGSSGIGFAGFLAYSGYGYFDTWHGVATLGLLIATVWGLVGIRRALRRQNTATEMPPSWGQRLLLIASAGLVLGGAIVMCVGMTCVFVPQDIRFMGITVAELDALNPRLIPLIAHDRAGFGGAACSCGWVMFGCVRHGWGQRGLMPALGCAGLAGFGCAIGVHPAVGYNDFFHILPAMIGAGVFLVGFVFAWRRPAAIAIGSP